TALQTHLKFFDTDDDGIIFPIDTYLGMRSIGFGRIFSTLAMLFIHFGFSYPTIPGWLPDPFLRIHIIRGHRAVHGSDTRAFSHEGELDNERFEKIFNFGEKDSLTIGEVFALIHGDMNPFDLFGTVAGIFEWGTTYLLLWPEDGRLKKEDIRGIMDGTLFHKLADK
ncbi:hypothetical protein M422DRAFT_118426, partial [Sphaerobolus stellatus SS14]